MISLKQLLINSILLLLTITLKTQASEPIPIPVADCCDRPPLVLRLPAYRLRPPTAARCCGAAPSCCDAASCCDALDSPSSAPAASFRVPKIDSLEELPALLVSELSRCETSKPKVFVFLDWDDTSTQRVGKLAVGGDQSYEFKYLFSPEVPRQLQPAIDEVINEMGGDSHTKRDMLQQAFDNFRHAHKYRATISYRNAHPTLPDILSQLRGSGVAVKVCSGLGLHIDSARETSVKELGFDPVHDYIHSSDKASAMVNYIAKAHSTVTDPAKAAEPTHYLAILVDNFLPGGASCFYRRFATELDEIQRTNLNIQMSSLLVMDTRFMKEARKQRLQLKREIGYTFELYRPILARQIEDATRRLAALTQSEGQLVELVAALSE